MKTMLLFAVFFSSLASADWAQDCVPMLTNGYAASEDQAEILCYMCTQGQLGCAMDMMDMKMATDIVEAAEYCRNPGLGLGK